MGLQCSGQGQGPSRRARAGLGHRTLREGELVESDVILSPRDITFEGGEECFREGEE